MAEWVHHGRPSIDMFGYDVRRFCPETTKDPNWVRQRSQEAYAKNYATVFPHDEPLAGRNTKKVGKYRTCHCEWQFKRSGS